MCSNAAASSGVLETDARGGEAPVGLVAEVQDHQRGEVFDGERNRCAGHLYANRVDVFLHVDDNRVADEAEVPRELPHAVSDRVRSDYQIVEQGIGAHRRQPGGLEREVRREALLQRARQNRPIRLARNPRIGIVEVRVAESCRRQQRGDVVTETSEGVQQDAQIARRRGPRRSRVAGRLRDAFGQ